MRPLFSFRGRIAASAAFAIGSLATGMAAHAQTTPDLIAVRAVDTPEGSRLSIPVGADGFEISVVGDRELDISILGSARPVDLSQINLGGTASRILSAREVVSEAGTRFRLILDCDCAARSRLTDGVLTIDIAPAFPSQNVRRPTPNEPAPGGTKFAPRWSPQPPPRRAAFNNGDVENGETASVGADAIGENDVALARESLLRQLTRAADQGLLTFQADDGDPNRPITPPDITTRREAAPDNAKPDGDKERARAPTGEGEQANELSPEPTPFALPAREADIRARTALDAAFAANRSDILLPPEPCPDPKLVSLPEIVGPGRFYEATAKLRLDIVDEFGHVSQDGVEALARHYISHGFGAEALVALSALDLAKAETPSRLMALFDMARIVDGTTPSSSGPFARWAVCGGPFRLWAEAGGLMRGAWAMQPLYADALVVALDETRPSLRNLLGAAILRSRLNQGDLETARRIDDIFRRTAGIEAPGFALEQARLAIALGGSAEVALAQLIERDTPDSVFALLALAATYGPDRLPPPDFSLRLSDAAYHARGGSQEALLTSADIRVSALAFGAPIALRKTLDALETDRLPRTLLLDAGHAAIETARPFVGDGDRAQNGTDYARAIINYAPYISKMRDGDAARTKAADALTEIGLPQLALSLAEDTEGDASPVLLAAAARARRASGGSGVGDVGQSAPSDDLASDSSDRSGPASDPAAAVPGRPAGGEAPANEGDLENARNLLNSASDARKKIEEALAADG